MISSRVHRAIQIGSRLPRPATRLDASYVWGGVIFGHFGHFITETLPRLLTVRTSLRADPGLRILGFAAPGVTSTSLAGLLGFMDLIDVDPALIDLIDQPTEVAALIVPRPPFRGRYSYDPSLLPLIDTCGLGAPAPSGERIFVSRGQLAAKSARVANIAEIEALYQSHGFTLFYPERHSIAEQIARLTACEVLAGENGSALHWSLYSRHIRQVHSLGWTLALQRGICAVRGQVFRPVRDPWLGRFRGRTQSVPVQAVLRALS